MRANKFKKCRECKTFGPIEDIYFYGTCWVCALKRIKVDSPVPQKEDGEMLLGIADPRELSY